MCLLILIFLVSFFFLVVCVLSLLSTWVIWLTSEKYNNVMTGNNHKIMKIFGCVLTQWGPECGENSCRTWGETRKELEMSGDEETKIDLKCPCAGKDRETKNYDKKINGHSNRDIVIIFTG